MALSKPNEGLKVTLDEVDDSRTLKSSSRRGKKTSTKVSSQEEEDSAEVKVEKEKKEGEGCGCCAGGGAAAKLGVLDRDALYEEMDKTGPFNRTVQGTL